MGKPKLPTTVTVSCPDHHQMLVEGLWKFFTKQHKVDLEFKLGSGSIVRAHGLIAEVFLNANEREEPVASSAAVDSSSDHCYHRAADRTGLDYLVEFMYNGRVTVPRDSLPDVMFIAEQLKFMHLVDAVTAVDGSTSKSPRTMNRETQTDVVDPAGAPASDVRSTEDISPSNKGPDRRRRRPLPSSKRASKQDSVDIEATPEDEQGGDAAFPTEEFEVHYQVDAARPDHSPGFGKSVEASVAEATPPIASTGLRRSLRSAAKRKVAYETAAADPADFGSEDRSATPVTARGRRSGGGGVRRPDVSCESAATQQHRCERCDNEYGSRGQLTHHMRHAHCMYADGESSEVACAECNFRCSGLKQLQEHRMRRHTNERPFPCQQCRRAFVTKHELSQHVRLSHLKIRNHACPEPGCTFRASTKYRLTEHGRRHSGERPFTCEKCGKGFTVAGNFARHKLIHEPTKKFMCHECGATLKSYDAYTQHMNRHRGIYPKWQRPGSEPRPEGHPPRRLPCGMCPFVAEHNIELGRHRKENHLGDALVPSCPVCGVTRKTFQAVSLHMRIHTGLKVHRCETCNRHFRQLPHLISHRRTHTKEQPYRCDICGRSFSQSANMRVHKRIHTGTQQPRVRRRRE